MTDLADERPPASPTIVVIDDATEILDLIEVVLTDEGFEVVICREAARALETVAAVRPALVIVDLRMVGVNGWELVDGLLDDLSTGGAPLIVCSGAAGELQAEAERVRERGGDVLTKPFDIDTLVSMVHDLIGGR